MDQKTEVITIALTVSDQFARDVLCAAIEGGSNYWARFKTLEFVKGEFVEEYSRVRVTEYGDDDKAQSVTEIGAAELREGIRRILANDFAKPDAGPHASYCAQIFQAVSQDDAGQIDAQLSDLILQAAALGGIVYG